MTTNPTNYYYPQYPSAPSTLLPATTTTTDNTDVNKLDRDLIYKYEGEDFLRLIGKIFFRFTFNLVIRYFLY